MIAQRVKRKLTSAGLVTLATVGLTVGVATAAQADNYINTYDTQSQCVSAKFWYSAYNPSVTYYCEFNSGYWNLWSK